MQGQVVMYRHLKEFKNCKKSFSINYHILWIGYSWDKMPRIDLSPCLLGMLCLGCLLGMLARNALLGMPARNALVGIHWLGCFARDACSECFARDACSGCLLGMLARNALLGMLAKSACRSKNSLCRTKNLVYTELGKVVNSGCYPSLFTISTQKINKAPFRCYRWVRAFSIINLETRKSNAERFCIPTP